MVKCSPSVPFIEQVCQCSIQQAWVVKDSGYLHGINSCFCETIRPNRTRTYIGRLEVCCFVHLSYGSVGQMNIGCGLFDLMYPSILFGYQPLRFSMIHHLSPSLTLLYTPIGMGLNCLYEQAVFSSWNSRPASLIRLRSKSSTLPYKNTVDDLFIVIRISSVGEDM